MEEQWRREEKKTFTRKKKLTCVSVVASATTKGTFTSRASVRASSVFPVPVGPRRSTLDFSSSTSEGVGKGGGGGGGGGGGAAAAAWRV